MEIESNGLKRTPYMSVYTIGSLCYDDDFLHYIYMYLKFFILTWRLVIQCLGELDVTDWVSVTMESEEWPTHQFYVFLDFCRAINPSFSKSAIGYKEKKNRYEFPQLIIQVE